MEGIGEYSPETASAHLLQCAEYPNEAKLRMQKRKNAKSSAPKVGIMYLVGGKLLIDSTPLAEADRYGDHLIPERGHIELWAELVKSGRAPKGEYEEFPRGRVAFDTKSSEYALLADRCILHRKSLVSGILSRLNLPAGGTRVDTDSHYRCYRCMGRSC